MSQLSKNIVFIIFLSSFLFGCGNPPTTVGSNESTPAPPTETIPEPENTPPTLNQVEDKTINEGDVLSFTLTGSDPDGDSLTFSASDLPFGSTFSSNIFYWETNSSSSGTFFPVFTVSDSKGEIVSITVKIIVVDVPSSPINQNPTFSSISSQEVYEGSSLTFSISATDSDGDSLNYSLLNPPTNSTFNTSTKTFNWIPSYTQAGSYSLNFLVSDGNGGTDTLSVSVLVLNSPDPISLSQTTFEEGSYSDNLLSLNFSLPKEVSSITATNWSSFFTTIEVSSPQGNSLDINDINNLDSINLQSKTGSFSITIKGSTKESSIGNIDFTVLYIDSTSQTFSIPITINSSGLPIFRYDIINSLDNSDNKSVSSSKIINQIKTMNTVLGSNITPILYNYQEKKISCLASTLTDFIYLNTDLNGHRNCVKNLVSTNSETVFFFSTITSGGSLVGGLSLGTRNGALISDSSFNHTIVHELGHNFGLVHTHETHASYNTHHSDSNWSVYSCENGCTTPSLRKVVYSFNESIFPLEYGDGIDDTGIDPFGSIYISSLSGGSSLYSSFNGSYEGEEHLLYKGKPSTTEMFTASNFACYQQYTGGSYVFNCPDFSPGYFDDNVIKNVMSYWYKIPGEEELTSDQIDKILDVLTNYPEIQ